MFAQAQAGQQGSPQQPPQQQPQVAQYQVPLYAATPTPQPATSMAPYQPISNQALAAPAVAPTNEQAAQVHQLLGLLVDIWCLYGLLQKDDSADVYLVYRHRSLLSSNNNSNNFNNRLFQCHQQGNLKLMYRLVCP